MKTEKGVMIIAYKDADTPRFLVLKRKKNWEGWETPKGHLENEDYEETVKIEMKEETGIEEKDLVEIEELEETAEWTFEEDEEGIKREYRGFAVKVHPDAHVDVSNNPHDEHEHGFFFRYRDAVEMLTYDENRELMEKVQERIKQSSEE